jgi:hypothetical protein
VYAARVAEIVPLDRYGADERFSLKIPRVSGEGWQRCGDNIYSIGEGGVWKQRRNPHHGPQHMQDDLSGQHVLLCPEFWYFGGSAPHLPQELHALVKVGPGCKRCQDASMAETLIAWLHQFQQGGRGDPFGPPI